MDTNNMFNMTEMLDLVITQLEELNKQYHNINENLQDMIRLTLDSTNSSDGLSVLINNSKYRDSFTKTIRDTGYLYENKGKQFSEIYNKLIEILTICKFAIPQAKKEGIEII